MTVANVDGANLQLNSLVLEEIFTTQVREETPSWPRSWANFSLLQLYSHRNAWANLQLLGQPDTLLARQERLKAVIFQHYTRQCIGELYKILLTADLLGNPIGLVNNIATGVCRGALDREGGEIETLENTTATTRKLLHSESTFCCQVFDFFYEPGAAIIRDPTAGSDEGLLSLSLPNSRLCGDSL